MAAGKLLKHNRLGVSDRPRAEAGHRVTAGDILHNNDRMGIDLFYMLCKEQLLREFTTNNPHR